jgi:hypothetical protein
MVKNLVRQIPLNWRGDPTALRLLSTLLRDSPEQHTKEQNFCRYCIRLISQYLQRNVATTVTARVDLVVSEFIPNWRTPTSIARYTQNLHEIFFIWFFPWISSNLEIFWREYGQPAITWTAQMLKNAYLQRLSHENSNVREVCVRRKAADDFLYNYSSASSTINKCKPKCSPSEKRDWNCHVFADSRRERICFLSWVCIGYYVHCLNKLYTM